MSRVFPVTPLSAPGRFRLSPLGVATVLALAAVAAQAQADPTFRCELTAASGLPPADAGAAAQVLCDELKRASEGRGAFGITLATLGKNVVVTATRDGGTDPVTVRVDSIEEVPRAAARIALALVKGEAFASTQRVDNLLEDEARPALTKKGAIKFSVGIADVESVGHGARAAGFSLGLQYASPRFTLPAEMRFAWGDYSYEKPGLDLFSLSVGGRYFLSKRDVSPFVGGGLGILRLHAREGDYPSPDRPGSVYFEAERFAVAPYVEVGVEVLRLHRGRVALQVRADFPTGALESQPFEAYTYDDRTGRPGASHVYPAQSRYVVPVSIGVSVTF